MNLLIVTTIMAPYRAELFEKIGETNKLTVCFEQKSEKTREKDWLFEKSDNYRAYFSKLDKAFLKRDIIKKINPQFDLIIFYEYSSFTSILIKYY